MKKFFCSELVAFKPDWQGSKALWWQPCQSDYFTLSFKFLTFKR